MANDEIGEKDWDLELDDPGSRLRSLLTLCETLGEWLHLFAPQFPQSRLRVAATIML